MVNNKIVLSAGLYAILLVLPFTGRFVPNYIISLVATMFMYVNIAISWNIISGYVGYFSFGHSAFFGIGAYFAAASMVNFHVSPYLGAIVGGLGAAATSSIIAYPILRLRGAYFSICTLVFSQAMMAVFLALPQFGGAMGIFLPPVYVLTEYYYAIMVLFLFAAIISYKIRSSYLGLALLSIREDEEASKSVGVNTTLYKIFAFVTAAFIAGIVGGLYAWYMTYIDPPGVFTTLFTLNAQVMTLVGGLGTFLGPIVGGIIFSIISEFLRTSFPEIYLIILGGTLIAVVMIIPGGFLGLWESLNKRFRNVPKRSGQGQKDPEGVRE